MNRLLTYPLLIWEFIGYMSIFTKQKQTSDLLPPAIGKLSIGPKSACPSSYIIPQKVTTLALKVPAGAVHEKGDNFQDPLLHTPAC